MMKQALLATALATGLILPAKAGVYLPPKPAIVKPENLEFSKNMLAMPFTMGMMKMKVGPAVTVINRSTISQNTSPTTSVTFSNMAIGTASSTRRVLAIISIEAPFTAGITITSVTIAGIGATMDVSATDPTGSPNATEITAIYAATVTSGTTANVVVNMSAAPSRLACLTYAIDNLSSVTPTDTMTSTTVDPATGTIDWQGSGYVVGACTTTGQTTFTWTGLTERSDNQYGASASWSTLTAADSLPTSGGTNQTVTADAAAKGARISLAVASYR